MSTLRLGTRGSQLALWQANTVKRRIEEAGGPRCEIVVIRTSGDRLQEAPLSEVGGKRLFVKEIEDALLRHDVDFAVHSSKDMPAVLPDGLAIAGVLPREDPLDAMVLPASAPRPPATISELVTTLGETPSIGTSSVRRIAQLTRLFPGARFAPIRGNLDTRLRKLDEGQHDAIVLAAAGLRRLGFASRISMTIPADACVPAPGQGIVAIEVREGDDATRRAVTRIEDRAAAAALRAERAVVERLGGGCQTPIGALATTADDGQLELVGAVVSLDGSRAVRAHARGPCEDAVALGTSVGEQLLAQGAGEILAEAQRAQGAVEGIQP
ncbi:MAG TPA: hydroxymethylbilane synthase [Vicinamibacterales bacterium]|nr:hydroxymethylbilane synthase [Vicinamibacterales bacterium]